MKVLTGLSPIDFIKEYRMNKAIKLLKKKEYNVTEASYSCGFSDIGYFSRCFKEFFGINPSEVAKK
ncbi:MAG: helix-turn-helix transcriptional regulator [Bacteroidales bacterium]|nr:helix-turn-helix transcriptional regulator [Bacteroidales bacterium]